MASFLKRSVSLRACSVVALVGSLFAGGAARADRLLTFEDAVTAESTFGGAVDFVSAMAGTGYGGFTWANAGAYQRRAVAINGYTVCVHTSQKGMYCYHGLSTTISRPGRWILHDFACTAAWNTGLSVRITGMRSGVVVYDQTHVLGAPVARTTLNLNFANIDSVTITTSGGSNYYTSGAGTHLAIDDLRWSLDANANGIDDDIDNAQTVVHWGQNYGGEGDIPADLGRCTAIASGDEHSVALRSDGIVRCWGSNSNGQSSTPSDLGACIAIAGGSYHTVAVRSDRTVRCWGWNIFGQCTVPSGLGSVTAVAAGSNHTVALKQDGTIACWGDDSYGQCAIPADLGPCTAIAGGSGHTVALRSDRTVRCWGANTLGECNVPADLGACSAVGAGWNHTIAVQMDGTVRCWGSNFYGQCTVPGDLGPCTAVAGGSGHTVALRTDGTVRCWGANRSGERDVPVDLGPCIAIAAGGMDGNTMAIRAGVADFGIALSSSVTSLSPGDTFTVRASSTAPAALLSGAQLAVHFDATRLRLDDVVTYAPSPLGMEIAEQINNTTGTLCYALGLSDPSIPLAGAANLCDLTFTVLPGADLCGATNLVTFGDVGAFTTRFTRFDNAAPVVPVLTNLPPINLDSTPPVLSGVPVADIFVATDAGSTFGALVSFPPVSAIDACEGDVSVTVTGATASGLYPIGTTTVTWSATDSVGNAVSVSRNIVVGDYQLLDARISFNGVLTANAPRSIRVSAGASVGVHPVTVLAGTGGFGMIAGIVVPVASSYPCVAAKDTVHSLTRTATTSIVGSRYEATFALVQGDSNNDDMIEIVDYATWVIDFGAGKAVNARSNFNADTLVNNADLGFVSTGFFTVGESCTGGLAGARPRERISVKELRRMGLGELAAADLNRDGWFDLRDMQIAVQGDAGGNGGAVAQPAAEAAGVQW
jgi:hypothetical protein